MATIVPDLPQEVLDYVRGVFAKCKRRAASKMSRMPTTHETALDFSLIEGISALGAPQQLSGRWVIRLDAHYLGGGRHFGEWEIGDIGLIVVIREHGTVRLRKVAILQSKRLYPNEQAFEEDTPLDYAIGFARLMPDDVTALAAEEQRLFTFTTDSRYRALSVADNQYQVIEEYEEQHQIPVHYLLHHPLEIPWEQTIPLPTIVDLESRECHLGAMVTRSCDVRDALSENAPDYHPTFADLSGNGWPLDQFVADELLRCREGYIAQGPNDSGLFQVFNRRTGPIAAAIAITIDRIGTSN
jgi:hypothetical protein